MVLDVRARQPEFQVSATACTTAGVLRERHIAHVEALGGARLRFA
jgi:stage V sporulation protein SpoVS